MLFYFVPNIVPNTRALLSLFRRHFTTVSNSLTETGEAYCLLKFTVFIRIYSVGDFFRLTTPLTLRIRLRLSGCQFVPNISGLAQKV